MPEIKVPQSRPTKNGSLLHQELDSSHVRKQTPDDLEAERNRGIVRDARGKRIRSGKPSELDLNEG
jgi:hypothetical protein